MRLTAQIYPAFFQKQSLSDSTKATARENIGAVSQAEVDAAILPVTSSIEDINEYLLLGGIPTSTVAQLPTNPAECLRSPVRYATDLLTLDGAASPGGNVFFDRNSATWKQYGRLAAAATPLALFRSIASKQAVTQRNDAGIYVSTITPASGSVPGSGTSGSATFSTDASTGGFALALGTVSATASVTAPNGNGRICPPSAFSTRYCQYQGKFSSLSTAANHQYWAQVGEGASNTLQANAVGFVYDESGSSGIAGISASPNWWAHTRVGSVSTLTNTGVAVAASTGLGGFSTLEYVHTATQVQFYIAGVLVATHATNVPWVTGPDHFSAAIIGLALGASQLTSKTLFLKQQTVICY